MPIQAIVERIVNDPGHREAMHAICTNILDLYARNPDRMGLIIDRGQIHMVCGAYYSDPMITAAAVNRLLPSDIAGRNRVSSFLNVLEHRGALEPSPIGVDRRSRSRRMAPWFRALIQEWLKAIASPSLPWMPQPWPDLDDSAICRLVVGQFIRSYARGGALLAAAPLVAQMMSLKGGVLLLHELMRRATLPVSEQPERFSRRAFAMRFGLSRTQVIDLIAAAAKHNLIAEAAGDIVPSPAMLSEGRTWLTLHLAAIILMMQGDLGDELRAARVPAPTARVMPGS